MSRNQSLVVSSRKLSRYSSLACSSLGFVRKRLSFSDPLCFSDETLLQELKSFSKQCYDCSAFVLVVSLVQRYAEQLWESSGLSPSLLFDGSSQKSLSYEAVKHGEEERLRGKAKILEEIINSQN